ncbi:MAG: hypothetical protein KDB00_15315, partial [Planctomycetales bacterium]|nr:hypothetical protein [Planctomycetales bacterium]
MKRTPGRNSSKKRRALLSRLHRKTTTQKRSKLLPGMERLEDRRLLAIDIPVNASSYEPKAVTEDATYRFEPNWGQVTIDKGIAEGNDRFNFSNVGSSVNVVIAKSETTALSGTNTVSAEGDLRPESITLSNESDVVTIQKGGKLEGNLLGGSGVDVLNYSDSEKPVTQPITVNLSTTPTRATFISGGIQNIEIVIGGAGDDHVTGISNATNRLAGGKGKDTLSGGEKDDLLVGGISPSISFFDTLTLFGSLAFAPANATNAVVVSNLEDDTPATTSQLSKDADELRGGGGNDVLVGGRGDDQLYGGTGDDALYGGAGDDAYFFEGVWGTDSIYDDDGVSELNFAKADAALSVLHSTGMLTISSGDNTLDAANLSASQTTIIGKPNADNFVAFAILPTEKVTLGSTISTSRWNVDLQNLNDDLTVVIDKVSGVNRTVIRDSQGMERIVVYGTHDLLGGNGNNTYSFVGDATLTGKLTGGSVSQPAGRLNTLDYTKYRDAVQVNLTSAPITNVQTTRFSEEKSVFSNVVEAGGVLPFSERWTLSAIGSTGAMTFSIGSETKKIHYSFIADGDGKDSQALVDAQLFRRELARLIGRNDFTVVKSYENETTSFIVAFDDPVVDAEAIFSFAKSNIGGWDNASRFGRTSNDTTIDVYTEATSGNITLPIHFEDKENRSRSIFAIPFDAPPEYIKSRIEDMASVYQWDVKPRALVSGMGTKDFPWRITFANMGRVSIQPSQEVPTILVPAMSATGIGNGATGKIDKIHAVKGTGEDLDLIYGPSADQHVIVDDLGGSIPGVIDAPNATLEFTLQKKAGQVTLRTGQPVRYLATGESIRGLDSNTVYYISVNLGDGGNSNETEVSVQFFQRIEDVVNAEKAIKIDLPTDAAARHAFYEVSELNGGDGDDRLISFVPSNAITRTNDGSVLYGGGGRDVLTGSNGADFIDGGDNDDTIYGDGSHNASNVGDNGRDIIRGGSGNDSIYGYIGPDFLDGGTGDDTLVGGSGSDVVRGEGGNDTLAVIERGNANDYDQLLGGPGNDTYRFTGEWGIASVDEGSGNGQDTIDLSDRSDSYVHVLSNGALFSTGGYLDGDVVRTASPAGGIIELNTNFNQLEGRKKSPGDVVTKVGFGLHQSAMGTPNLETQNGSGVPQDESNAILKAVVPLATETAAPTVDDGLFRLQHALSLAIYIDLGSTKRRIDFTLPADGYGNRQTVQNAFIDEVYRSIGGPEGQSLQGRINWLENEIGLRIELVKQHVGSAVNTLQITALADGTRDVLGNVMPAQIALTANVANTVVAGSSSASSFGNVEQLIPSTGANTFVFGNEYWQAGLFAGIDSLGDVLGLVNPFNTGNAAEDGLRIDTSALVAKEIGAGQPLTIDLRAVNTELEFFFSKADHGDGVKLTIKTVLDANLPYFDFGPKLRYNSVEFSNVGPDTVLYTGRYKNTITIENGVQFDGSLIGGDGYGFGPNMAGRAFDQARWLLETAEQATYDFPNVTADIGSFLYEVENTLKYSQSSLRTHVNLQTLASAGDASTDENVVGAATDLLTANWTPVFDVIPKLNKTSGLSGLTDNIGEEHLGEVVVKSGLNFVRGTDWNPYKDVKDAVTSGDALDKLVGTYTSIFGGADTISVGDSINSITPGLHFLAGGTGADTYQFRTQFWGLAAILEPPALQFDSAEGQEEVTNAAGTLSSLLLADTLDMSGVFQDLHFTVLEFSTEDLGVITEALKVFGADADDALNAITASPVQFGSSVVIVTPGGADGESLRNRLLPFFSGFEDPVPSDSTFADVVQSAIGNLNIALAFGIENIVGGRGKNTIQLVNRATLQGNVAAGSGGSINMDYSRFNPASGITTDLGQDQDSGGIPGDVAVLFDGVPQLQALLPTAPLHWGRTENLGGLFGGQFAIAGGGDVIGTDFNDNLKGNSTETNSLSGGKGNDTLWGRTGSDELEGGEGNDTLYGNDPSDSVDGSDDNDLLNGGDGDDSIFGGRGNDALIAGPGNDNIDGGSGTDVYIPDTDAKLHVKPASGSDLVGFEVDIIDHVSEIRINRVFSSKTVGSGNPDKNVFGLRLPADNSNFEVPSETAFTINPLDFNGTSAMGHSYDVNISDAERLYFGNWSASKTWLGAFANGAQTVSFYSSAIDTTSISQPQDPILTLNLNGLSAEIVRDTFGWTKDDPNQIPLALADPMLAEDSDPLPAGAPLGTHESLLLDGLTQFATWSEGLGTKIGQEIQNVIPLPFIDTGLQSLWQSTGIGTTISSTIRHHVESVFALPGEITYEDFITVDSSLQDILTVHLAPSNMLTEFEANVELTSTGICFGGTDPSCSDINLDFLKDFGLDLTSFVSLEMPEQLDLEAAIDLRFGFGIDPLGGGFYVEDPTLVARLKVDHDQPLDVSLNVGPVGVGIEQGTIFFQAGLILPTEGRFGVDDLAGGLSIGSPRFDPQSSYKIDLPFKLQGALAGLVDEVGSVYGSLNYAEPGQLRNLALAIENLTAAQFFQMIPDTLNFEGPNFGALENLTKISLDEALLGIEGILRDAIASDGVAYQKLPFINQSAVDLLGSNSVNVVDSIANAIQTVRGELSDINRFEIDLNQQLNATLALGLNIGGEEVDAAYDNIVALSTGLTARSSDDDLAIALAQKNHTAAFESLLLDRNAVAANDRLTSRGLDGDSSDEQIATTLADPTLLSATFTLRNVVAADSVFSDAWNRLSRYDVDGNTSDTEIQNLFDATEIIALAIENRDVLLDAGATDDEKQFARIQLSRIGIAPDATDQEINDTFARDSEIAQIQFDRDIIAAAPAAVQDAAAQLRALGLAGNSTDLGVASALVGAEVVELWKADRDFVASFAAAYSETHPGTTLTTAEIVALAVARLQAKMAYPATAVLAGDSTDAELARSLIDPASFEARITDRDILAQYDANKSIDLEYGESVLDFDFSMAKAFGGNYDLAFDIADLPGLGEVLTGDKGIGLTLTTDGQVFVDADINFDLNFTFDLSEIGNPSFVIYDDSQITFNKFIVETLAPIDIEGSITLDKKPVLTLAVKDAVVQADLEGTISLTESNQVGYHKISDLVSDSSLWNVDLLGSVSADLPFFFPTDSFPFGGSDQDLDSDGVADNVLHVGGTFTGVNEYDLEFVTPRLNYAEMFDVFAILNDPEAIINGLNAIFYNAKQGISKYFTPPTPGEPAPLQLPLIGDALKDAPAFLDDLRGKLVVPLQNVLQPGIDAGRSTIEIIREEVFKSIGDHLVTLGIDPNTGLETRTSLINSTDLADLNARLQSSDPTIAAAARSEMELLADQIPITISDDGIEFKVLIGGSILDEMVPLDFSGAVPGLGLEFDSNAQINVKLDYLFAFGFGFSKTDGFYLDTSGGTPTGEEISLDLNVTLTDDVTNPASVAATLGFIKLQLVDVVPKLLENGEFVDNPNDDGKLTGLFGSFDIDLIDAGNDGRMTLFGGGGVETLDVEVRLTAGADMDVYASLELGGGAQFPSISTTIHFDQTFAQAKLSAGSSGVSASATFGGSPRFVLENVSLDIGTFITEFAGPVLEEIKTIIDPLDPILDVLTMELPVLSDLGTPVTLLDLAEQFSGGKFNRGFIDAVIALRSVIESIPTSSESIMIGFGDFVIMDGSGKNDLRDGSKKLSDTPDSTDPNYSLDKQLNNPTGGTAGSTQQAVKPKSKGFINKLRNLKGFSIPLITNPANVFGLITGKTVDLLLYNPPSLALPIQYAQSFPIFPGANAGFKGRADITLDIGFGFDTSGIEAFKASGDVADIFSGFFVRDAPGPELGFSLDIGAGLSAGVAGLVELGAKGGLTADVDFDLADPNNDGKVRFDELGERLAMGAHCVFDTSGDISAFFEAFFKVSIGPFVFVDEQWELLRITLSSFNASCTPEPPPNLADVESNILTLNMGDRAAARTYGDKADATQLLDDQDQPIVDSQGNLVLRGERFEISQRNVDGQEMIVVSFNGFEEQEEVTVGEVTERVTVMYPVTGFTKIVARGGAGNDTIIVHDGVTVELEIDGGTGDDVINVLSSDPATAPRTTIMGGPGNDTIVTGAGIDTIDGGDGDDIIRSGAGNDIINGGAGADRIMGEDGNDVIRGGDEGLLISHTGTAGSFTLTFAGQKTVGIGFNATASTLETEIERLPGINDVVVRGAGTSANPWYIIFVDPAGNILPTFDDSSLTGSRLNVAMAGDRISGGSGDDLIFGGKGADTLFGDDGNDWIEGQDDGDRLLGLEGADTLLGGSGNDDLFGGAGADVIIAGAGDDAIRWTGLRNETIVDAQGDETTIQVDDGVDVLVSAGVGQDIYHVTGSNFDDTITIGTGTLADWSGVRPGDSAAFSEIGGNGVSFSVNGLISTVTAIESVQVDAKSGADAVDIQDLRGTSVTSINADLGLAGSTVTQLREAVDGNGNSQRWLLEDASGNLGPAVDANNIPLTDGDGSAKFYAVGESVLDADGNPETYVGGEPKFYLGNELVLDADGLPLLYDGSEPVLAYGGERVYDAGGVPQFEGPGETQSQRTVNYVEQTAEGPVLRTRIETVYSYGTPKVYAAGEHMRGPDGALMYHEAGTPQLHRAEELIPGETFAAGEPILRRANEPVLDADGNA